MKFAKHRSNSSASANANKKRWSPPRAARGNQRSAAFRRTTRKCGCKPSENTGEAVVDTKGNARRLAGEARAGAEQKVSGAQGTLDERTAGRQQAIARLQGFAATDLLSVAMPEVDVPDLRAPWTIEPALNLARRAEQALSSIPDDDDSWRRIQGRLSQDYTELGSALTIRPRWTKPPITVLLSLSSTRTVQNGPIGSRSSWTLKSPSAANYLPLANARSWRIISRPRSPPRFQIVGGCRASG